MVQLKVVAGEQAEMAPPTSYIPASYIPGCLIPVDQLPHTSFVQSGSVEVSYSSHSPLAPNLCPETGTDTSCSQETMLTSGSTPSFLPSEPCMSPSMVSSSIHSLIFTSSSIDNIPVTDLSSESQKSSSDLTSDVSKTFEIIPVNETCSYGAVDNAHAAPSFSTDNSLQTDTRTDSVDSLLESRGYSSDGSDVYMNSDYTDTVTSADSSTFLLSVKHCDHRNSDSSDAQCAENSAMMGSFYSNEAFTRDCRKEQVTWSSEDCVHEPIEKEAAGESSCETRRWDISITIPEEDAGAMADKEDDENDPEDRESVPLQENSALDNLVNHLAEQHPQEVVDIRIEVLDQPVYPSLTEALEEERSWLQSTDSLHHYKLLKQGRSTTLNNLRVHTLSSLRANTMNNLHERSSFLNLTAASVSNLGNACQKALSYVRADMEFGSMMSIGNSGFSSSLFPGKQPPPDDVEELGSDKKSGQATVASGCHTRNMLYMALLVTILLISVNTTRNLQSSLNQEGGVGIICLAVMFASYTLGSLLSPLLVQGQGVKVCVILGLVLQLLYVAANLYPRLWLMLPASLGGGASLALIWNAMSTYMVLLARGESQYRQKSYQRVADKYFGIFCLIYQSNLIVGNLIASLVLTFAGGDDGSAPVPLNSSLINSTSPNLSSLDGAVTALSPLQEVGADLLGAVLDGNGTDNNSVAAAQPFDALTDSHYHLCGAEYCHHFVLNQESSAVPERTVYLLFGIFMLLVVGAILIAIFLLEPLSPRPFSSVTTPWHNVKRQVLSLVKFSRNTKFLLMLPLLLYSSMQFSFVCSEVMMAYVTCPVGVWLVGYTMIGYGVSCSLSSYLTQALVSRTGRGFFIGLVLEKMRVLV